MTALKGTLAALLTLAALTAACGPANTPPPSVESYFPKDNEVGAWVGGTTAGKTGVQVATTAKEAEALVNGDAAPFNDKGMVTFAWEKYAKDAYTLDLRVWQFKDASAATDAYGHLVANASLYKAATWTDLAVGDAGRIADTGTTWWLNSHKGAFIIEAKINPKDATSRADIEALGIAVAAKIK
ncbi:MAG: hypothetical protein ACYC8T_02430 [Myxococcaceae bacterium]